MKEQKTCSGRGCGSQKVDPGQLLGHPGGQAAVTGAISVRANLERPFNSDDSVRGAATR